MGSRGVLIPISLRHIPARRPVSDGYGFLFSIIVSIARIPCAYVAPLLRMLSALFRVSPLMVPYIMPDPTPTDNTNPLSIPSADRSQSFYVTPALSCCLYRTLHLLSPASPLFSVLIAFGCPSCDFRVKKQILITSSVYTVSIWAGVVLHYSLLLFSVSSRSPMSLHSNSYTKNLYRIHL